MIKATKYFSYSTGSIPKGCKLCVQGKKLVLFITGICSRRCIYCPISDLKKNKDVVYANEWPVSKLQEVIAEAKLCRSAGAGITGGDPLARLSRTLKAIKMLKKAFKDFHIHLYTPLTLVTEGKIKMLEKAGLDEIRFHPDLDDDKLWQKLSIKTRIPKGVEIPVVPGKEKQIKKLIDFLKDKVDFLNLNELEISDTNSNKLSELGFRTKDNISYAIKGSDSLAKRLLKYCDKLGISTHYCTVKLKDAVQLVNRIKRRAKNVKKPYDRLTRESTLIRGAIYLKDPSFGYVRWARTTKEKKKYLKKLGLLRLRLIKAYNIPKDMIEVEPVKLRLLTSAAIVRKIQAAKYFKYIVEDLPTYDQFEIESEEI
ncbi:MAG: radical SAM protein [Candidatus Woesearchaeota archaeon]